MGRKSHKKHIQNNEQKRGDQVNRQQPQLPVATAGTVAEQQLEEDTEVPVAMAGATAEQQLEEDTEVPVAMAGTTAAQQLEDDEYDIVDFVNVGQGFVPDAQEEEEGFELDSTPEEGEARFAPETQGWFVVEPDNNATTAGVTNDQGVIGAVFGGSGGGDSSQ